MLALLDSLFRFAAVGVLLLGGIVLVRGAERAAARWLVAAFVGCVAAYLLFSSPVVHPRLGALDLPLRVLAIAAPAVLWMASLALFSDGFRLAARHFVPLALLEAAQLTAFYTAESNPVLCTAAGYLHQGMVLLLYAAAVVRAWKGYSGDLIEARRRFRSWFVVCASAMGVAIAVAELVLWREAAPGWLELLKVIVIAGLAVTLVAWALDLKPTWFATLESAPKPLAFPGDVSAAERQVLNALKLAVETEKAYRQNGLTIAALAGRIKIPEHALRKVINQRLGHRNFNAFLNSYRIEEVEAALADPAKARLPVLTLALEAGFASIGPFNRAFKEAFGVTPTRFREARMPAESEITAPIPESAANRRV